MNISIDNDILSNYKQPEAPVTPMTPTIGEEIPVAPTVTEEEVQTEVQPEIIRMSGANYGAFKDILGILSKGISMTTSITITNGKLLMGSGNGYIHCDMTDFLGNTNFEIMDTAKTIRRMGFIKGGDTITIIDDQEEKKYLISKIVDDVVQETTILDQVQESTRVIIDFPEVGDTLSSIVIEADQAATFKNAEKATESDYFVIEIDNISNDIISLSTKDGEYKKIFKMITPDMDIKKYKAFNPFPILKVDEIVLKVSKDKEDNMWISTENNSGIITVNYAEKIQMVEEFDNWNL